jgi:hypothetical protein
MAKRSPLVLAVAFLLLLTGTLPAEEPGKDEKTALAEFAALKKSLTEKYVAFEKAQEPSEENGHTYGEYYANLYDPAQNPLARAVPLLENFEKVHRGSPAGLEALLLVLRYARYRRRWVETKAPACLELLFEHYARYERAGELGSLGNFAGDAEATLKALDRLVRETPHHAVRARCTVGKVLLFNALRRGEDSRAGLKVLETTYADAVYKNTPCGELARAWPLPRHAEADLVPGKRAPEIEGYDPDGEPVRLSDCRGKVTVLVFWGWW